jgi:hypothetical protein
MLRRLPSAGPARQVASKAPRRCLVSLAGRQLRPSWTPARLVTGSLPSTRFFAGLGLAHFMASQTHTSLAHWAYLYRVSLPLYPPRPWSVTSWAVRHSVPARTDQCSCTAETVKVPQMAESISEGTLKQWVKNVGDFVNRDEEVATIETDKVSCDREVHSSGSCYLTVLLPDRRDCQCASSGDHH